MDLTVACVPTGMNTGVSITQCAVCKRPRRARVFESFVMSSNFILYAGAVYDRASFRE